VPRETHGSRGVGSRYIVDVINALDLNICVVARPALGRRRSTRWGGKVGERL